MALWKVLHKVHNRASGNIKPGKQDVGLIYTRKESGKLQDIPFTGPLIIFNEGYLSM